MSCLNYLLEQPGATIAMTPHGLSSGSIQYKCNRTSSCNLAFMKRIGPGHRHPKHNWLYCSNVSHSNDGAFDIINATYEGLHADAYPTGGFTLGTMQTTLALHPNYKQPGAGFGQVFGVGFSPNTFGRVLHEDGSFKAMGPLPDGLDGRPAPAQGVDVDKLEGIENYLVPGMVSWKYSLLHDDGPRARCGPINKLSNESRLSVRLMPDLGKIIQPISKAIPVPTPPYPEADWLFSSCTEDTKVQNRGNVKYYTVNLEYQASGKGGWNKNIYDVGAVHKLP
jgi:hypothetical protein